MATLIPSFASCAQRMTPGERRVAQRLNDKLEDDYLCWYNIPVGANRLHPDYVILHPQRGLLILEVKDWKLESIQTANPDEFTILTIDGIKSLINPLEQARNYAMAIANMLQRDPLLVQTGRYQGKLVCPYGYGVVFPNIRRKAFERSELVEIINPGLVICQDDMTETIDPMDFQQRLWGMSRYSFGTILTLPQFDRIRWHLFPDIRVNGSTFDTTPVSELVVPDLVRIMDIQQELIARSLGDGHRVIHGVAGSGKTMILAYRCLHLTERFSKPILVLCYNVTLASRLRQIIAERELTQQVSVQHFHGWCKTMLQRYNLSRPDWKRLTPQQYAEQLVDRVIQAVEQKCIPIGQYSAILIDEGHDFQPEWLKLIAQMVDPSTNALLLLYDDAQTLYQQKRQQRFSFKSVGIQAQGRTTILKLNYRNTLEVLTLAYEFAREVLVPTVNMDDDDMPLVQPQSAGRHGVSPELVFQSSYAQECIYLARKFQEFHNQGIAWSQMAIVYRVKWMAETLNRHFQNAGLPIEWLNQSDSSRHYQPEHDSIKVMTLHSSKGLEFQVLGIPGLGYLPYAHESIEDETRLLYVGITRAMDRLLLTYHQRSAIVEKLQRALATIKYS